MTTEMIFARLKPWNPKLGCVKRRWTHSPSGVRFTAPGEWYKIPAFLQPQLAEFKQDDYNPLSPALLDFAKDEKEKLEVEAEYNRLALAALQRAGHHVREYSRIYNPEDLRPGILTTAKLPENQPTAAPAPVSEPEPAPETEPESEPKPDRSSPRRRRRRTADVE